jgi:hypothetical protein
MGRGGRATALCVLVMLISTAPGDVHSVLSSGPGRFAHAAEAQPSLRKGEGLGEGSLCPCSWAEAAAASTKTTMTMTTTSKVIPLLRMRGGGLHKKFLKGLPLNAEEKAFFDKVKRIGLNRVMQEAEGPTRRELAEKKTKEMSRGKRKAKVEEKSERIKAGTAKKLAILDGGSKGGGEGGRGGGRPQREGEKLRIGGQPSRPSLLLAKKKADALLAGKGKEGAEGDGEGDSDEVMAITDVGDKSKGKGGKAKEGKGKGAGADKPVKRGSLFDEAMKNKI